MKTLDISEANETLSTYARRLGRGSLVVTRRGKPVFALVPLTGGDLESLTVASSPAFQAIIERSRARCKPGSGVSTDEMRERVARLRR